MKRFYIVATDETYTDPMLLLKDLSNAWDPDGQDKVLIEDAERYVHCLERMADGDSEDIWGYTVLCTVD